MEKLTDECKLVANYIIEKINEYNEKKSFREQIMMTAKRLQKLLYFCDIEYMKRNNGTPLFKDEFVAWESGPVIEDLFHVYMVHLDSISPSHNVSNSILNKDIRQLIDEILEITKNMDTVDLFKISNIVGGPWDKANKEKKERISKKTIYEFYLNKELFENKESLSMKNEEKNIHSMDINFLISLCYVIYDFKPFEQELLKFMSSNCDKNFILNLSNLSRGNFVLGNKKTKEFYSENKLTIDTIEKYSNIASFIALNHNAQGVPDENLTFFYNYILGHKDEIFKILILLKKLKELGFSNVEFNENADFTNEIYTAYSRFGENSQITFLDNIGIVPNYGSDINYKTLGSNYKMELSTNFDEFSKYGNKITLNSLVFDSINLPNKIDKKTIFEYLLLLKEKNNQQIKKLKDSIDLNVNILDLEKELNFLYNIINRIDSVTHKEELSEILINIKEKVEKLKELSTNYDNKITEEELLLSTELLEKEKTLYLNRRDRYIIDLC